MIDLGVNMPIAKTTFTIILSCFKTESKTLSQLQHSGSRDASSGLGRQPESLLLYENHFSGYSSIKK